MDADQYMINLRQFILDNVTDVPNMEVEFNEVDYVLKENNLNNLIVIHQSVKLPDYMSGNNDLAFLCYLHHEDRLELQRLKQKIFNEIDLKFNGNARYICEDISEPFVGTLGKTKYKAIRFMIKILV